LGQEGQKTDIISKTSDAFGPHVSGQWGSVPSALRWGPIQTSTGLA